MAKSLALRRHDRAIIGLSLAYAAALIGANLVFKGAAPNGPLAYAVAVLPALPIIGMFAAIGRYLNEEQDEYVRMLAVRKTLIASAFALSIATAWGFLESFNVAGHVDSYYIAVLWFGGLGVGACFNQIAPAGAAA
ncbi:MAG: hypothetical protein B7Y43_13450 [Sphingomonas sp. 28-62-20]|uniref:hypothetical protein n=1 Tax=unclassified Sphingomonas TaxID=196159 RepID=UPI000BDB90D7|nr:hypothetical protein [Sphingomonas sp.]OYY76762.1 MAG: hypothetical protein B7Y43_13450 [Sphingomonas sp. 28-62-20]